MATTRAMRRFRPDPVPESMLWRIIEAGTQAPNGANRQVWHFIIVQDAITKRFIQQRYSTALEQYVEAEMKSAPESALTIPDQASEERIRIASAGADLAKHLAEAPALLFACIDRTPAQRIGGTAAQISEVYASIYPAVQNMLLACRGLGLGAVLTTLHLLNEEQIKEHLGIPGHIHVAAMIPMGYPRGRFGPVRRRPPPRRGHPLGQVG